MHIALETEKERRRDKLTEFFLQCEKVISFDVRIELDSKTILNSASKLNTNKLNTDIS